MSDSPWLRHLPEGWKTSRLKTVVKLRTVRVNSRASDENYIGLEAIEPWTGRLLESNILPSTSDDENENKNVSSSFEPGDVLFGKLRPYLAKGHLAREAGICTTELLVMTPRKNLDAKFLLNVLLTREFIGRVDAETFGTKMPRADWGTIRNLSIPLPTLPEQRAIADFLDRETAKIDELISEKERLIELLAEKRWALITHAVTRGLDPEAPMRDSGVEWLGEIPRHWGKQLAKWLFKEVDERSNTGEGDLLTVSHLTGVTLRSEKEVNMFMAETLEGYKICQPGDLVINTLWAWMGAMGVAFQHGLISPAYNVYRSLGQLEPRFVDYLVRIPIFAQEVIRYSKGVWSSRLRLYPEGFFQVVLPVPPVEEQRIIVDSLDRETEKMDSLNTATQETIKLLRERRAALISAAVTGQIRVGAEP